MSMSLRFLVLFWGFALTSSCVSPLDCNAKECLDCVCKDGECYCADGWSGPNCTTPFCVKRADCSNHGDCIATLTNISCVCDVGWAGPRCEAPVCSLNCTHGGVADANCTRCVGCLGAWYGKQCDQWNASVPLDTLINLLEGIAADSQAALDALAPIRPLCSQSQECLGWGVDLTYGGLSTLPVLQLSYTDPTKTWSGFREPVEATVTFAENPQFDFQIGSGVYPLISDFTNMVGAKLGAGIGLAGIYGDLWETVFQQHYQQPGDFAMTVVQAQMWLYQMNLQSTAPALDKFAARAIASLPPDYNSAVNQALYQRFIKNWGTSVVTESYSGGVIEQYSDWKSFLLDKPYSFDQNFLLNNAQIDFTSTLGIGGHSGTVDANYAANRHNETMCLGGNPASCFDVPSWQASLIQNPILVRYQSTPLATYISDVTTRTNVQQALHAYIAQQNAVWAGLDKCPTTCNNHGTCAQSSSACTCTFYSGRMCSNPTISREYLLQDKGNNAMTMMPVHDGFCFITNGHGWYKSGEHCQITNDGQTWILNKASGQSYFECGSHCVYSPSWSTDQISTEYYLSGTGTAIVDMIPISKGFCFLTDGSAFYEGGESCWISANGTTGTWTLFKTSGQDGFSCGARCVYSDPTTSKTTEYTLQGKGNYQRTLVSVEAGICFLTHSRSWYESGEHCWITIDQGTWTLRSTSGQDAFICGARCTGG